MSLSRLFLLALAISAALGSTPAYAQSADAGTLFHDGIAAARDHRWADATRAFRAAYELTGRAELLINIATSLAEQARWAAARASYVRFMESAPPTLRSAHRERVEAAIRRAEAHAGSLRVSVLDPHLGTRVLIDGQEAMPDERVWVDPGAHRVTLSDTTDVLDEISVQVRPGELRSLVLGADRSSPVLARPSAGDDEPASIDFVWVAVVVAIVAAAGIAIGLSVELTRDRGFVGNLGPGRWVTALIEL